MRTIVCLMLLLAVPAMAGTRSASPSTRQPGLYDLLSERVAAAYDSARGGFVDRRGVPSESAVELAMLRSVESKSPQWRARGIETIVWTRGLFDSAGGGYHHGAPSADPQNPAFEKRTDSNARRLENLLLAWRVTGDATYRKEAARVADFLTRVPFDARGGFAAGQFGHDQLIPEINGIAAHAWMEWAAVTREARRRDEALATIDRVWTLHWNETHGFVRAEAGPTPVPLLVDQVEMGRAFVIAASVAGRAQDRKRAAAIGDFVLARFTDEKKGAFRTRSQLRKNGSVAGARLVSEENARAARFLCELAGLTGNDRYRLAAGRAWMHFADDHRKPSLAAADWALAVRAAVDADLTATPKWERLATHEEPAKPAAKPKARGKGRK